LTAELEDLAERTHSDVHYIRFSEIQETHLARFLEKRFLTSGHVTAFDLHTLRRA
jgi:hypothetical protein